MALEFYRRGQGKNTRLSSAFALATIAAFGCFRLFEKLDATDLDFAVKALVPAFLFGGICILIYWLSNRPSLADFFISAEGEMKKVNWSSRQEIITSTIIVIAVVIIMASLLGMTDLGFRALFTWFLA
jgi:preprotein translocase subunit SecE